MGWERFQHLVHDYLYVLFGGTESTKIIAPEKGGPDGGRDFELIFLTPHRKYRAYVECKNHKDKLGLDTLGKYLVVVIVNDVDELIIVSSSLVTESSRVQFAQVAARTRVKLSIIDGVNLEEELLRFPDLLSKYFPAVVPDAPRAKTYMISASASIRAASELGDISIKTAKRVRIYDDSFYIHIHVKNHTSEYITISGIRIDGGKDIVMAAHPEYALPGELGPLQDAALVSCCRLRFRQEKVAGAKLIITYLKDGAEHFCTLSLPVIELSTISNPPLVGRLIENFISREMSDLTEEICSGQPKLLDIRGASGVGKSRFLSEIASRLREATILTLTYDAMRAKDSLFSRLVSDLMGLPIFRGGTAYGRKDVYDLLCARGCASEHVESICDFLLDSEAGWSKYYSVVETVKSLLATPVRGRAVALIVDNIQELSPTSLQAILDILIFLSEAQACCGIVLATNIEIMPVGIAKPLAEFQRQLESFGQGSFRKELIVEPLSREEAQHLASSLLRLNSTDPLAKQLASKDDVAEKLVEKAGTRPLDILMAVHWLEEKGAIKRRGSLTWFIADFETFRHCMQEVPRGSASLIRHRLKAIGHAFFSRWPSIESALQYLTAFGGRIPAAFVSRNSLRTGVQILLDRSMLRLEIDAGREFFAAFHDNIYRYLSTASAWRPNRKQSDNAFKWISRQDQEHREELALPLVFNAIRAGRSTSEVIDLGEHALGRSSRYNPADVRELGDKLSGFLERSQLAASDFQRYAKIRVDYANALLHQATVTDGLKVFEDLYQKIGGNKLTQDSAKDHFYHKFVNANLHSGRHRRALQILQERHRDPPKNPWYKFLLLDRFGVVYTALGEPSKASDWLQEALLLALESGEPEWESLAYYDIGYLHVQITFDAVRASQAFERSIDAFERSPEKPAWRRIEAFESRALVALLSGATEDAILNLENAIWLSRSERGLFYQVRMINILGLAYVLDRRYQDARLAFEESRSKAAMSFNERGFWRATANLGALSAICDSPVTALDYLDEAERYLEKSSLGEGVLARDSPLIFNYLAVCAELGDRERTDRIRSIWEGEGFDVVAQALLCDPRSRRRSFGAFCHAGFAFIAA